MIDEPTTVTSIKLRVSQFNEVKKRGMDLSKYVRECLDREFEDVEYLKSKIIEKENEIKQMKKYLSEKKVEEKDNLKEANRLKKECLSKAVFDEGIMTYDSSTLLKPLVTEISKLTGRNYQEVFKEIIEEAKND